jgi:hypothetical protein
MKLVQFTLYEIFGYVFPGATAMAGVFLIYWALLLPDNQDWNDLSKGGWIAIFMVAYIFGHFVQAITNLPLKKKDYQPEHCFFTQDPTIPSAIKSVLNERAREAAGLGQGEQLTAKIIYDIADHTVLQYGKTDTRDTYIYREGFYRGMTMGLLLFAIGCFVHMIDSASSIRVFGVIIDITRWQLFLNGSIAVVMMFLSFGRYKRFANYRVKYALYSFLITSSYKKKEGNND